MISYGEARDPEWIKESIIAFEQIAACVTEVLENDLLISRIPQGSHSPMVEAATSAICASMMVAFGLDRLEQVKTEIWPRYAARTYALYDQALTQSKEQHNG